MRGEATAICVMNYTYHQAIPYRISNERGLPPKLHLAPKVKGKDHRYKGLHIVLLVTYRIKPETRFEALHDTNAFENISNMMRLALMLGHTQAFDFTKPTYRSENALATFWQPELDNGRNEEE